jgi:hypothetical protein
MELRFIVVEYVPSAMDGEELRPARIDGHYAKMADAKDVADWWAESPMHQQSRIVVAEVRLEVKKPKEWENG